MIFFKIFTALALILSLSPVFAQQKSNTTSIPLDIDADFLYLPISCESDYRLVRIVDENGVEVFSEPVMLASGKGQWFAPVNVSAQKGRKLFVEFDNKGFIGEPIILLSDSVFSRDYSKDKGRPKYHISATNGVLGASSGLFFFEGKYYAYILQNPKGMSMLGRFQLALWESSDLVNWKSVDSVNFFKSLIVSPASAYVDNFNKSGLFSTKGKGIIFAASNERNKTFLASAERVEDIKLVDDGKPILSGEGKWPFLFYNKDSGLWTIVRTESNDSGKTNFAAIYVSKDLREWEFVDKAFEGLANTNVNMASVGVLGADSQKKWVLLAGDGSYIVGDFDGKSFKQISKKPLQIFAGLVSFVQAWSNMPNSNLVATATLVQPLPVMLHIKQHFVNTLSLPWQLDLVRVIGGEYQLRASVPSQIMEHIGFHKDAVGGDMIFRSNTFVLPEAHGNYCMYSGTFEVDNTSSVSFEVGTAVFGYDLDSHKFFMRRLLKDIASWDAPVKRSLKIIPHKTFVDSYSAEMAWFSGDIVLMMGDSFLNPEQTIKVGAAGVVRVSQLDMFPVFKNKIKALRNATIKVFRSKSEQTQEQLK